MERENFIYSLMYKEDKKQKLNINTQIEELEKRINKLVHVKLHTKVIDLETRRIEIEIKIDKINIGFTRFIEFSKLKDIDKVEKALKQQIETVIKLYFNL